MNELVASTNCRLIQAAFVSEHKLTTGSASVEEDRKGAKYRGQKKIKEDKALGGQGDQAGSEIWQGPCLSHISVRMTLIGNFGGLVELLKLLHVLEPKVHVGQLKIELVDHDHSELNVSFVLSVFSMEQDEGGRK